MVLLVFLREISGKKIDFAKRRKKTEFFNSDAELTKGRACRPTDPLINFYD